jgi:hypothetical protein
VGVMRWNPERPQSSLRRSATRSVACFALYASAITNELKTDLHDPVTETPKFKACTVRVERLPANDAARGRIFVESDRSLFRCGRRRGLALEVSRLTPVGKLPTIRLQHACLSTPCRPSV